MHDFWVRANGLLTPTPHGSRVTVSVDTIRLQRDRSGETSASWRLGVAPFDEDAVKASELLLQAEYGTGLQSAVAEVRERRDSDGRLLVRTASVLARLETVGGPVLLGTFGSDNIVNTTQVMPTELGSPPPDWRDRPILLHPWVAAVVVAGAGFSLTSQRGRQAAQRIAGKRVLPGLTLTDLPEPTFDYRGAAEPSTLVDRGRVRVPPTGRATWDHDVGGFGASPLTRLELDGPSAVPSDALELVWCVEGLQRYHADGVLRLHCLAHAGGEDWFPVRLSGKPIHLLRGVRGVSGPRVAVYTDSEVLTRSLVLSCAAELENVDVEL